MNFKNCFLIFLGIVTQIHAAKIIGAFNIASFSHQIVFQRIWAELARRGHEMIVITPNVLQNNTMKNLRQIDIGFTYPLLQTGLNLSDILQLDRTWRHQYWYQMDKLTDIDALALAHEQVQKVIKYEKGVDLVIAQFMTPTMLGFGAKFGCPMVTITSLYPYNVMYDSFGNPAHPALHPEYMTGLSGTLTFWERLQSFGFALWQKWHFYNTVLPKSDSIVKKYMGKNLPYLGDVMQNISMMFTNVNPLVIPPKPNLPTVVEFTGMHIREHNPLPGDIKQFLDNSKHGVIYLSLGTNVKSALLPLDLRQKILQALSELKYDVLWKFEDDSLKNKPAKVMIKKWIPQQDVLGHKKIKLFITQGGAQSLEEAIHNGVPIVGIPIFSDQPRNIRTAKSLGIGLGIHAKKFTTEEFKDIITEVIENKKYKEKIQELAARVKDQPMNSLDRVVWWIEYVIRHKGAYHLRSPYADIQWWKYLCMDIVLFIVCTIIIAVFFIIHATRYFMRLFRETITIKIKHQ